MPRAVLLTLPVILLLGLVPSSSSSEATPVDDGAGHDASAGRQAAKGKRFDPNAAWLGEDSSERRMLAALEAGDAKSARAIGEAALPTAERLSRGRLRWLLARIEQAEDGDADKRRRHLQALYESDHPLSRWAGVLWAESLKDSGSRSAAAQAAWIARGLTRGWAGSWRARKVQALALFRAGDAERAERKLRLLVAETPNHVGAASTALPLADLLIERGTPATLEEALGLYRRVASRAPLSAAGQGAGERAKKLLKRLPKKARARLSTPSVEDRFHHGKALHRARHYEDAQALFEKLETRVKADAKLRCQARLEAGRALVYRRKRTEAAAVMRELAERCQDPEVRVWARYYGGRARLRSGDPKGALLEYAALVKEFPQHSLADDALYLSATAHNDVGDRAAKGAVLERLVKEYPRGDMRADARFSLAFAARAAGDHAGALRHFEALLQEGARDDTEGVEGRAAYWRARTLQTLGRKAEARGALTAIVRTRPLSYHAQQARARLKEGWPRAAAALEKELLAEAKDHAPLTFPWRAEMGEAAFTSALELLRIDELELAKLELTRLGAMGRQPGQADAASVDEELVWLGAALLHRARAYASASKLVRAKLEGYRAQTPRGRARHLWRIAYPRAFSPLIEDVAAEMGVPPAFVRAVAREESAFNPKAVSSARAYGLIQVMRGTAKSHAKALGLPSTPDALKRPEVNLRIGSRFIRTLWTRYADNPAVVPAAYNAGHGAADRWLKARGGHDLDEWIERIPFRETRRYTRRVLQTYGIYAWLDGGRMIELGKKLPAR